jgi:DNA-binding LytR/AlgR family response regulator
VAPEPAALPISTLVVDDEALARSLLATLVKRDAGLRLVGCCRDGAEALEQIATSEPDLVFLDIHMPVIDGLTVARRLATLEHVPYVIFVTAFDEHAIEAFELNALDYLVKPLQKARFNAAVERAKSAIRNRELLGLTERLLALGRDRQPHSGEPTPTETELTVRCGDSLVQLTSADIIWIEAANQYVLIHTATNTYTVSETLAAYSKRVADARFFRVHRSALVNGTAVVDVAKRKNGTHRLRLRNGDTLTVARSRAALVPGILRSARLAAAKA